MNIRLAITRLVSLLALSLCGASAADSVLFGPTFCGFHSGCGEVTSSIYARPLGIPLPLIGMAGFAGVLCLSLLPDRRAFVASRLLAIAAGLAAIALIAIQMLVLDRICSMCMAIDVCGIVIALLALLPQSLPERHRLIWLIGPAWMIAGLAATMGPIVFAFFQVDPTPPPQVTARWVPHKVNVVELTDFDCPYCARFEPVMADALRGMNDCHFVRIPTPMPKHENGRPAARAFLAASQQGKGEEMASALFAAESRSANDCRLLAVNLGLDMSAFDRFVADPALDAEFDETLSWAQRAGQMLPMIWVQDRFFPRVPSFGALRHALLQVAPYEPTSDRSK